MTDQRAATLDPAPEPADLLRLHLEDVLRRVDAFLRSPEGSATFSVASRNFALDVRQDVIFALDVTADLPR